MQQWQDYQPAPSKQLQRQHRILFISFFIGGIHLVLSGLETAELSSNMHKFHWLMLFIHTAMFMKECYIIKVCLRRSGIEQGLWCSFMGFTFALFRMVHEGRNQVIDDVGKWIIYLSSILLCLYLIEMVTLWRL